MSWALSWFWRLVFWWKRRTGWIDLGQTIVATGTVIEADPPGPDGDGNFDLGLDPGQEWMITGLGGRLTSCPPVDQPSIHCEVEPWATTDLRERCARLRVGDRVRVTGVWGFDGVHTGRPMWIEILLALVRHSPNLRDGWLEIHPVTKIDRLVEQARGDREDQIQQLRKARNLLKHGPRGSGDRGSCDSDCRKCELDRQIQELSREASS